MTDINVTSGNDSIEVTSGTDTINIQAVGINSTLSYVDAGTKIRFDGSDGDSYLIYNTSTDKVEMWVNGVRKRIWG